MRKTKENPLEPLGRDALATTARTVQEARTGFIGVRAVQDTGMNPPDVRPRRGHCVPARWQRLTTPRGTRAKEKVMLY